MQRTHGPPLEAKRHFRRWALGKSKLDLVMQKRSNHSSGYCNLALTGRTHMLLQVSWYRSHSVYWPLHEISWKGDSKRPVGFGECYSLEPQLRSESGAIGGHVLNFSTLCRRFPPVQEVSTCWPRDSFPVSNSTPRPKRSTKTEIPDGRDLRLVESLTTA